MKWLFSFTIPISRILICFTAVIFVDYSSGLFAQQTVEVQNTGTINLLKLKSGSDLISLVPASATQTVYAGHINTDQPILSVLPDPVWELKFSAPGKVFKDISFADSQVGYIVTELGGVYKSVNGGDNWSSVMNLGFPYYWYGVDALSPDTVVISGFNNQAPIAQGVVRWTYDGGATWSTDINLSIPSSAVGWLERVHFFNADTGIIMNSFSGGCWFTANGGKQAGDWTYVTINTDLAWFSGNIDAQQSGRVYATGIHFAHSSDFGTSWISGPCADIVFDGGVDFLDFDNLFGWTGGGQISAPVAGWVCRTTDGGMSWSPRLNTFEWPIRVVHFLDESKGWVAGGNLYDEAGGIYSTTDGGITWNLEVSTSAEMFSMEFLPFSSDSIDIWCAGSTGGGTGFTGKLYKIRIGYPLTNISLNPSGTTTGFDLYQNVPNPFEQSTTIGFFIPISSLTTMKIYDLRGNEVRTLVNQIEPAGYGSVSFNGSDLPSGIYYVKFKAGNYSATRKFVLSN